MVKFFNHLGHLWLNKNWRKPPPTTKASKDCPLSQLEASDFPKQTDMGTHIHTYTHAHTYTQTQKQCPWPEEFKKVWKIWHVNWIQKEMWSIRPKLIWLTFIYFLLQNLQITKTAGQYSNPEDMGKNVRECDHCSQCDTIPRELKVKVWDHLSPTGKNNQNSIQVSHKFISHSSSLISSFFIIVNFNANGIRPQTRPKPCLLSGRLRIKTATHHWQYPLQTAARD